MTIPMQDQDKDNEKPPSYRPRPVRPWRVAVIANVKGETPLPIDAPADAGAEFRSGKRSEFPWHVLSSCGPACLVRSAACRAGNPEASGVNIVSCTRLSSECFDR